MLWLKKNWIALLVVVFLAGGFYYMIHHQGVLKARSDESAKQLQISKDSIAVLEDNLGRSQKALRLAVHRIDTLWKVRQTFVKEADVHGGKADDAISLAPPGEGCKEIRTAYEERTLECVALRRALVADSISIRSTRDSLVDVQRRLGSTTISLAEVRERLNIVSKPYVCKIAGLLPCVSRTWTFIGGAVAGGAAYHFLRK